MSPEGVFGLRGSFTSEEEGEHLTMTIGIYNNHAFLITDLEKAAKIYECTHCGARFTKSTHLLRHAETCSNGQTKIKCPGERVCTPDSLYERAFYPIGKFGKKACCWLEYEARQRGIHIHHHRCGHGGERVIAGHVVDGYHPESKTVFQYHGCHFHGCPQCFPSKEEREVVICRQKKRNVIVTREKEYETTLRRNEAIIAAGYNLVVCWEHEMPQPYWYARLPRIQNETFPHAIVYDFKSYQDPRKKEAPTAFLVFEREHVPVSVSLADTFDREPEHIVAKDPTELVRKFWEALLRRGEVLRARIRQEYMSEDFELLPKKQKTIIRE